jgi:hypothetical protein
LEPPVSPSDVNGHRTDILLQNEPDWITWPYTLFHHERAGGADRRMTREVELCSRCEDAHPTRARRIFLRQNKGRFGEIEFASNLLHALGRNAGRVRQNRELIATERCRTENIEDMKCVLHELNPGSPQALTTRSISTQAPSGSSAAPIVVRAGKG